VLAVGCRPAIVFPVQNGSSPCEDSSVCAGGAFVSFEREETLNGAICGKERASAKFPVYGAARRRDGISEDNAARVTDVIVDELNLKVLGFAQSTSAKTRRPGYHPWTQLKIYVCGYLDPIAPSRRLEREAQRNV